MKKTLFHLVYVLDVGGTENMLKRLIPELQKDYRNVVICMKGTGELGETLEKRKIDVHYLHHRGVLSLHRTFLRFRRLAKKYRPQILNTYLPIPDLFGRITGKILQIPKIICHLRSTNKDRYSKVVLVDYLTSWLVDEYTVNSPAIIDHYTSRFKFNRKKFTPILNYMDFKKFDPQNTKSDLKKKLNIPPEHLVISCVANFHINKGHTYLLEAFEKAFKKDPNITLLLIGDGEERQNLQNQIKDYSSKNEIRFLGQRNDVPKLLALSDIFAMPTFFEGLSNALIEAMISKCAVITTDIPENKVLIRHNETGLLVPLGNASKITACLNELIKKPTFRKRLAKNARKSIQNRFNPSKILNQYRKLFDDQYGHKKRFNQR